MDTTQEKAIELYRAGIRVDDIAARLSVTRPTIYNWLKYWGIPTTRRAKERQQLNCLQCRKPIKKWRSSVKGRSFCGSTCYFDYRGSKGFKDSTHGRRKARKAVSAVYNLREGYVVHHLNGDENDNRLENLTVFSSQANHLSFHHGLPGCAQPIKRFDGQRIPSQQPKEKIRTYYAPRVTKSNTPSDTLENVTNGNNSLIFETSSPSSGARLHGHKPGCGCSEADWMPK